MATLIDSNVIVSLLIESDKTADARVVLGSIDDPVTIMSVVEECMYVGLSLVYGVRGHSLKAEIERGLGDVAKQFVGGLGLFLEEFGVEVVDTPRDVVLLSAFIRDYGLLPNDALIAVSCRFHGIREIASFDDDFRRVDFLKIVEP